MAVPLIIVHPADAARAYRSTAAPSGASFGSVLQNAVGTVADSLTGAEAASRAAISGSGSITAVVSAVAQAQLAMQTAASIRDRLVQAYDDVMKMPI